MPCCCSSVGSAIERHFNEQMAARDIERYRSKGPPLTTTLLRDGLRASGAIRGTLLDIGSGIGALTFELLDIGIQRARAIDASEAYVRAARDETQRRGLEEAIDWQHGDFVARASEFQPATVVTLDRVVCCYPAPEPLLAAAVRRAEQWFAISYPKDRWYVRVVTALQNIGRRLRRNPFRTFVHPVAAMERLIGDAGFRRVSRSGSLVWGADVYARRDVAPPTGI